MSGCAQSAGSGFSFADTPGNLRSTPSRPSASSFERQPHDESIAIRMHGGFDFDGRAVEHEAAREPAGPHVERLPRGGKIAERRGFAVRAVARYRPSRPSEKRCGFSRSHWISGFFACSQSLRYGYFCVLPRTLIGTCACSSLKPFGFGKLCQAHCAWVISGTSDEYCSGKVCSPVMSAVKREIAVADHERRRLVDGRDRGVVAGHQRVAVDGRGLGEPRHDQSRKQAKEQRA